MVSKLNISGLVDFFPARPNVLRKHHHSFLFPRYVNELVILKQLFVYSDNRSLKDGTSDVTVLFKEKSDGCLRNAEFAE